MSCGRDIQKVREQNVDAFNRIRVAEPFTQLEFKQTSPDNALFITSDTTGDGVIFIEGSKSSSLLTGGTGSVIQSTIQSATYQPGKSMQFFITGVMNEPGFDSECTARAGLFDDNNGIFFEVVDGDWFTVIRNNGVDDRVPLSQWNGEKLDFTLDPTKAQLFGVDATWLGVGSVQFYVYNNDRQYGVHTSNHANTVESPYTRNLNLPLRYQLISDNGVDSRMRSICGTVTSEGGYKPAANTFSVNYGNTKKVAVDTGTPLLALRLKNGLLNRARIDITNFTVANTEATDYLVELWYCPPGATFTLTGANFVSNTNYSAVEYDRSATVFTPGPECAIVESNYGLRDNDNFNVIKSDIRLGKSCDGTVSSTFVLHYYPLNGSNRDVYASANYSQYF